MPAVCSALCKCFPIASSPQLAGGVGGGGIATTTTVRALVSQKRVPRLRGVKYISWKMVEWESQHRVQSLHGLTVSKLDMEGVLLLLLLSHFSRVRLVRPHRQQPKRLLCPWDSPDKNTGVGCHFLLQCMKVKSESEVAQSCLTPSDPMDCSPPGSSIHGIFQARVLEWGAIAFSATDIWGSIILCCRAVQCIVGS